MSACSNCKDCAHLILDSNVVKKETIFSQTVCVFCWMPLKSSSTFQAAQTMPLVSDCGHIFHGLCLERRERLYPQTLIRCPLDGLIIAKTKTLHVKKKEVETGKMIDSLKDFGKREELFNLFEEAKGIAKKI